jgi:membrane associated rhomboid family serine protease
MIPLRDDNPSELRPVVTITLIALCVVTFLWQILHGQQGQAMLGYSFGLVPSVLFGFDNLPPELAKVPPTLTIFTSMFLHGGWMHIIGNMLYLWIFGDNVEDSMGHVRFAIFYLLCGVAAALAQAIPEPQSQVPMIGASGAISGVLGAYVMLYPHARVLVLIPLGIIMQTVRLPAGVVLLLWFALQLVSNIFTAPGSGGVAFRAHIGGFIAGVLLVLVFKKRGVRLFHQPVS